MSEFVALEFPSWIRWKQRGGAYIDNDALALAYPDHRHYVRNPQPEGLPVWITVGIVRRCGWCAKPCSGRRRAWCSEACSSAFYRVWSWGALTTYVYARDRGTCRRCGSEEGGPAHGNRYSGWQVDHIKPVRNGGDDNPENLRLLCHDCHVAVGYEQRAAERPPAPPPTQLELDGAA